MNAAPPLTLREGRFTRLEAIEWWDQNRLASARLLVVGAGALGNEVIKNLALLGVGHIAVADMDRVELSNLSRSVLFRESDEGAPKAECAARAARQIYEGLNAQPIVGNVLGEVGLGWFRWADAVIGALDNREARLFVNSACARVGRPWVDGGIEALHGIVRGFAPPKTACYECTLGEADWALLNQRRSCSMLARRAIAQRGTPTTPTIASIIGAIQVQEVVKLLHGREALFGRGFVFDGARHDSYTVHYPIHPDCPWHEPPPPIESAALSADTPLTEIWGFACQRLGGVDAIELSRELVEKLHCPQCNLAQTIFQPAEVLREERLPCPQCSGERTPQFLHTLASGNDLLAKSPRQIGLPAWDILWARFGERSLGIELAADNPLTPAVSNGSRT